MRLRRIALLLVGCVLLAAAAACAAFSLSPWPRALLIRADYERNSRAVGRRLAAIAPKDVAAQTDLPYADEPDALLDVYYPEGLAQDRALPTIVWLHGGGWLSGDKSEVAGYLKMLAARGYTVVGVNYALAPGATYPTPVRQTFAALAFLVREAARLHIDPERFVIAGDSAGAQIGAQVAEMIGDPAYARRVGATPTIARASLRGALLFCGVYELSMFDTVGRGAGVTRGFLWAYSGHKDFTNAPAFESFSVARYATEDFPPTFLTAGNADLYVEQSRKFVAVLQARGVPVDALFFPEDYRPALAHEYQFDMDSEAGRLALDRAALFLDRVTRGAPSGG